MAVWTVAVADSGCCWNAIHARQDVKSEKVCTVKLAADVVNKFTDAVVNHYWYQLYLDDLPIWGMVGE
eukprot:15252-Eustigmatos_ZCMA.PRE.1